MPKPAAARAGTAIQRLLEKANTVRAAAKDGVGGHLYENADGAGGVAPLVHLMSPSPLEEAIGRVKDAGGAVISEIIPLPDGAGRFVYCTDPDSNQFGLFTRD